MTSVRRPFTLLAGVEISGGQLSTLHHGEIDARHSFGDPAEAARHFIGAGAQWIHVADLDAAAGTGSNTAAVQAVLRECAGRAHVQLVGGIRDDATLTAALATKATRVVLDTAALADLPWVTGVLSTHRDRVALSITAEHHSVHAPDTSIHGMLLADLVEQVSHLGAGSFLVSDIDAKGLRKSSERHALDVVCRTLRGHVIADGGIFRLSDLHAVTELVPDGLEAAVIDAALYTGGFTWAEAEAAIAERYDLFIWGPPTA